MPISNPFSKKTSGARELSAASRPLRNAVILPDGTKEEPMGSGVITGILGVGGMANVYEIWNAQLEVGRAVKLLHPNYTEDTRQRFQTEIKITAKLHHPNIIEIHAVGQWNSLPFIEMERIDGETLEKILADRGALPLEVCTSIALLIGSALQYAHNQEYVIYGHQYHGVIHRDLKPSNIMVPADGMVKLMDFGIARPTDASIHTTDGSILGTMQYLSPEQLEGKEADIRTDIYALGTILYEMVTGVKAFPEHNVSKLMFSKIKNDYKSIGQYMLKITPRLRRVIQHAMAHDPEKRIADATTFVSEIGKVHRTLTAELPGQVIRRYLGLAMVERTVVRERFVFPPRLTVAVLVAAIAAGGFFFGNRWVLRHNSTGQPDVTVSPSAAQIVSPVTPPAGPQVSPAAEKVPPTHLTKQGVIHPTNLSTASPQVVPLAEQRPAVVSSIPVADTGSIRDALMRTYATDDMLAIFVEEVKRGTFSSALDVYTKLSAVQLASSKAIVFKIRALRGSDKRAELREFINNNSVDDAEFYLEKAKVLFESQQIEEAMQELKKSRQTPGRYSDNSFLHLEQLYYQARCSSCLFDKHPSEEAKRVTLDQWYAVKLVLRTSQDHSYYRMAEREMQRIVRKMHEMKG